MTTLGLTCLACGEEIDIESLLAAFDDERIVCPSCDGRTTDLVGAGSPSHEAT